VRVIRDERGRKKMGPARKSAGPKNIRNMSTRKARVSLGLKLAPVSVFRNETEASNVGQKPVGQREGTE
jgi:hypothetical protein